MIVRILGEGRYDVATADLAGVEELDAALTRAVDDDDSDGFDTALAALVERVRKVGTLLPPDDLQTSELVVPHAGTSLGEVKQLLAQEGGA